MVDFSWIITRWIHLDFIFIIKMKMTSSWLPLAIISSLILWYNIPIINFFRLRDWMSPEYSDTGLQEVNPTRLTLSYWLFYSVLFLWRVQFTFKSLFVRRSSYCRNVLFHYQSRNSLLQFGKTVDFVVTVKSFWLSVFRGIYKPRPSDYVIDSTFD